jgi:ubiquinone/menaquinone biosynthesis C-methylase UbiE
MELSDNDYLGYNRNAWNKQVEKGNKWTKPVDESEIRAAVKGVLEILLTPCKPVPMDWFPEKGAKVLGLASGGGQQCPLMAAYGFDVTSFDQSPAQLEQDLKTARSYDLSIKCMEGNMEDLSMFSDNSFDMVFNPCSTGFISDVEKVYHEVGRILKPGGIFMTGFTNPVFYLFDIAQAEKGVFTLKYSQPYSDFELKNDPAIKKFIEQDEPLVFGHSMEAHINGQLKAGMNLTHLFEDIWGDQHPVDQHFPSFMATRAVKV